MTRFDFQVYGIADGGRKPECANETDMALPIGPLWSKSTAEPVAIPSLL
jgi:hypothetical protein